MIRYKTRAGVILVEVCGQYLLAASKEARQYCPYTTLINETSAFLWKQMEKGASFDELMSHVQEEYETDDRNEAGEAVQAFLDEMEKLGYLLKEEEGHV